MDHARNPGRKVSVVMTVLNDRSGCRQTLDSLSRQNRPADEIVVVDGGSSDGTLNTIRQAAANNPAITLVEAPGANISRGRNLGIEAAAGEIVALTDAGCRADADWLKELIAPFERDASVQFVAGAYQIEWTTLFERVVGLTTMRGQLDPFDPKRFNPSARSLAMTKSVWKRAGGFPEWLYTAEDTLFDIQVRRMGASWHFTQKAFVSWRPRSTFRKLAKQFYLYGRGEGHTGLNRQAHHYNARTLVLLALSVTGCFWSGWALIVVAMLFAHFGVRAFHHRACRVAKAAGYSPAYPLSLAVQWIVLLFGTVGYVAGRLQRALDPPRYVASLRHYLADNPARIPHQEPA